MNTARRFRQRRSRTGFYPAGPPVIALAAGRMEWPVLWNRVARSLRAQGYSDSTLRLYRHAIRQFSRWFYSTPDRVTAKAVKAYLCNLADRHVSWSWLSMNISILRRVFDHLCGMPVCADMVGPKRPQSLPALLSQDEVWRLLSAADTARDQLLLGLIYGCGLKVGEACALRWADVDCANRELAIATRGRARRVSFPSQLAPLLDQGTRTCAPSDHIFRGARPGAHLSVRMAEYVLRRAAELAKLDKPVSCMTLRHSYAVHGLQGGLSIRQVQEALGLQSIHSAMPYLRCVLPPGACAPLELFPRPAQPASAPAVPAVAAPVTLPFEPVVLSFSDRTRLFCRSLKLHLRRRFLALRDARDTS